MLLKKHLPMLAGLSALFLASCQTTDPKGAMSMRTPPPPNEFRGAWVYDPRGYEPEDVVRELKAAGFNAVFVRLSSAGAASYPSAVLPRAAGSTRDYAQEYVDAGRRYGVQIHAWHVCFMMHLAPPGDVKKAINSGQVMRNSKGQAIRPTYNVPVRTPALELNRDLERRAMVELVTKYPLAGVQFDYIRYFSPGVDYSATARAGFERMLGRKVKKWPKDVVSGSLRNRYFQWKTDLVTQVVRETSQAIHAVRPGVMVSAAVWHSAEVGLRDYCQDWPLWVRKGYLDFVVPMDYTSDAGRFSDWVEEQRQLVQGKVPVYPGIGSYMLNTPAQLNDQINRGRRAGATGYVLYNYDERLKQRFLPAIPN